MCVSVAYGLFGCVYHGALSSTAERLLIENRELQQLIRRYAGAGLSLSDHQRMRTLADRCDKVTKHWLIPVLNYSDATVDSTRFGSAAPALQRTLRSMGADTPISGFVNRPRRLVSVFDALSRSKDITGMPEMYALLLDNCPALAEIVRTTKPAEALFGALVPFFEFLADWGLQAFVDSEAHSVVAQSVIVSPSLMVHAELSEKEREPALPLQPRSVQSGEHACKRHGMQRALSARCTDLAIGCFFGSDMQLQRPLNEYKANHLSRADRSDCKRKDQADRGRRLTHGILVLMCPHGIVRGFVVLKDFESERVVFEMLFTRFSQGAALCCVGVSRC